MNGRYKLIGHEPVPVENLLEWGRWLQTSDRHVAETFIGEHRVSTVFLGLDHNYCGDGPPLLFETMAFGPMHAVKWFDGSTREIHSTLDFQPRCSTWEEAEVQHEEICSQIRSMITKSELETARAISSAKVGKE